MLTLGEIRDAIDKGYYISSDLCSISLEKPGFLYQLFSTSLFVSPSRTWHLESALVKYNLLVEKELKRFSSTTEKVIKIVKETLRMLEDRPISGVARSWVDHINCHVSNRENGFEGYLNTCATRIQRMYRRPLKSLPLIKKIDLSSLIDEMKAHNYPIEISEKTIRRCVARAKEMVLKVFNAPKAVYSLTYPQIPQGFPPDGLFQDLTRGHFEEGKSFPGPDKLPFSITVCRKGRRGSVHIFPPHCSPCGKSRGFYRIGIPGEGFYKEVYGGVSYFLSEEKMRVEPSVLMVPVQRAPGALIHKFSLLEGLLKFPANEARSKLNDIIKALPYAVAKESIIRSIDQLPKFYARQDVLNEIESAFRVPEERLSLLEKASLISTYIERRVIVHYSKKSEHTLKDKQFVSWAEGLTDIVSYRTLQERIQSMDVEDKDLLQKVSFSKYLIWKGADLLKILTKIPSSEHKGVFLERMGSILCYTHIEELVGHLNSMPDFLNPEEVGNLASLTSGLFEDVQWKKILNNLKGFIKRQDLIEKVELEEDPQQRQELRVLLELLFTEEDKNTLKESIKRAELARDLVQGSFLGRSFAITEVPESIRTRETNYEAYVQKRYSHDLLMHLRQFSKRREKEPLQDILFPLGFMPIVEAAEALNVSNYSHGDIKPSNILCSSDSKGVRFHLTDFDFLAPYHVDTRFGAHVEEERYPQWDIFARYGITMPSLDVHSLVFTLLEQVCAPVHGPLYEIGCMQIEDIKGVSWDLFYIKLISKIYLGSSMESMGKRVLEDKEIQFRTQEELRAYQTSKAIYKVIEYYRGCIEEQLRLWSRFCSKGTGAVGKIYEMRGKKGGHHSLYIKNLFLELEPHYLTYPVFKEFLKEVYNLAHPPQPES